MSAKQRGTPPPSAPAGPIRNRTLVRLAAGVDGFDDASASRPAVQVQIPGLFQAFTDDESIVDGAAFEAHYITPWVAEFGSLQPRPIGLDVLEDFLLDARKLFERSREAWLERAVDRNAMFPRRNNVKVGEFKIRRVGLYAAARNSWLALDSIRAGRNVFAVAADEVATVDPDSVFASRRPPGERATTPDGEAAASPPSSAPGPALSVSGTDSAGSGAPLSATGSRTTGGYDDAMDRVMQKVSTAVPELIPPFGHLLLCLFVATRIATRVHELSWYLRATQLPAKVGALPGELAALAGRIPDDGRRQQAGDSCGRLARAVSEFQAVLDELKGRELAVDIKALRAEIEAAVAALGHQQAPIGTDRQPKTTPAGDAMRACVDLIVTAKGLHPIRDKAKFDKWVRGQYFEERRRVKKSESWFHSIKSQFKNLYENRLLKTQGDSTPPSAAEAFDDALEFVSGGRKQDLVDQLTNRKKKKWSAPQVGRPAPRDMYILPAADHFENLARRPGARWKVD